MSARKLRLFKQLRSKILMRPLSPTSSTTPMKLTKPIKPMRPMRPTRPMKSTRPVCPLRCRCWKSTRTVCPLRCHCCSHSPSQNVPQSSRKWRDLLELTTINFWSLKLPLMMLAEDCMTEMRSTINRELGWCTRAIAPFKTGGSNGFEVVGINSTINLCTQSLSHKFLELAVLPQNTMPLPQKLKYHSTWKSHFEWWLEWLDWAVLGLLDGSLDGVLLGSLDGVLLGSLDGILIGSFDGVLLGYLDGSLDGISLGSFDGV